MLLIASAVAVALQLEAGVAAMHRQQDDTYVEYDLPGHPYRLGYITPAFGAGLKLTSSKLETTIGWRNIGNQHARASIVWDTDYWNYVKHHDAVPNHREWEEWFSVGNVQQTYVELGYRLRFGDWYLVPSAGIAENRIQWHCNVYDKHNGKHDDNFTAKTQIHPAGFVGLSLERGHWGIGLFYLETKPNTSLVDDPAYPGQGPNTIYTRITYNW